MSLTPESIYIQLGKLIEAMPDLTTRPINPAVFQWTGKVAALIEHMGDLSDLVAFRSAADHLTTVNGYQNAQAIISIVHRALARAELAAPTASQGAFIPAGNAFDAFTAVGKVLASAKRSALIVDPYMDEKALTDFVVLAAETVSIRLLADQKFHKSSLLPATSRWKVQYSNKRPLEVRLASPGTLHDRLIEIDNSEVWLLTQSLNAFAARSPATIAKLDSETTKLKISAYDALWRSATVLQ